MQQTKLLIDDLCVVFVLFDLDYICLISHLLHLSTSVITSAMESLYLKLGYLGHPRSAHLWY